MFTPRWRGPATGGRTTTTSAARWSGSTAGWRAGSGFERAGIRGLAKMRLRVTMALTIMLALALGRIRAGQREHLRSLVRPA